MKLNSKRLLFTISFVSVVRLHVFHTARNRFDSKIDRCLCGECVECLRKSLIIVSIELLLIGMLPALVHFKPFEHNIFTLFACILFDALMTDITLDLTTPFEFASTLPFFVELMDIISAAATQQITTVQTVCGEIARPIDGAKRTGA